MRYGISVPNFGIFGNIDTLVEIAVEAEECGWDGFFMWDHMLIFREEPILEFVDPWIAMTAIACNTKKMKLGPLVTPLPRRRPWKLAREAVTLDHLSKGRLVLGVGIGAPPEAEYVAFNEEGNAGIRAEKLDECLEIITGLWSGEKFSFSGKHYNLEEMTFLPRPCQRPRIPIWVGGGWPFTAPFKRAARFDGVAPVHSKWPKQLETANLVEILKVVKSERQSLENYDIVVCGYTSGTDSTKDRETIASWANLGVTWWTEEISDIRAKLDELRNRIRAGPPSE
ncbi:MAG: LLM class flavin-dependent oxidoreductase [Candidatus Thorarchaeota archaeon]|nr:LLM class flavin-dependent oxidoreductase [Candidatus Thorarchaeota archaeon]